MLYQTSYTRNRRFIVFDVINVESEIEENSLKE